MTLRGTESRQFNIGHICTRLQCEQGRADRIALRWVNPDLTASSLTFGELERQSNRVANAVRASGLCKGDILFIWLPRTLEFFPALLGALKAELTVVTPFSRLGDEALVDRMRHAQAAAILARRRTAKHHKAWREAIPSLRRIFVLDGNGEQAEARDWQSALKAASDDFTAPVTDASVPALLHTTPSASGNPRLVVHVHGSVEHLRATTQSVLQLGRDDLFWCTADHGWVTGVSYGVIGPWSLGVSQLHFGGGYTAATWLGLLEREAVTVWYTAPTVLRMLRREGAEVLARSNLARLRHIFTVGEWLEPELAAWAREALGREVYDTYFQTETGGIVVSNRPGRPVKSGSMGTAVEDIVAGLQPTHCEGRPGMELWLRRGWPSMFAGYLRAPAATDARFDGDRYLTGDLARMDADGHFHWCGRRDALVNTAGHLVSPADVERALMECPEVLECAVARVPDAVLLEKVAAFVVPAPPHAASPELDLRLRMHVTRRLSPIEAPHEVHFVDRLPLDATGGPDREALRSWRNKSKDC
jgi:acetyl-CoA synthetase